MVDDHSRLAHSEIPADEKGSTCAEFILRAANYFQSQGISSIQGVITDNHFSYRRSAHVAAVVAQLHAKHLFIKPHCPGQNGKVERYNRTLQSEWSYWRVFASNADCAQALHPGSSSTTLNAATAHSTDSHRSADCNQRHDRLQLGRDDAFVESFQRCYCGAETIGQYLRSPSLPKFLTLRKANAMDRAEPATGLRVGSISGRHLVVFVIAAAAPLTILVGFAPLGLLYTGVGLPVGYVIAGAAYLTFAVGFTAMTRHIGGVGAFYAYIAAGLGEKWGSASAAMAYVGYLGGQIGFVAACGIFTSSTIASLTGVGVPVYACALGAAVLIGALAYCRVDLGAKLLALLMALELGVLTVFCVAVLARGGGEGLSLVSFTPSSFLVPGFGAALSLTFLAFIGFEQTAVYSAEVDNPRRTVARATYIGVTTLMVIYAVCSWVIVMAIGPSRLGRALSGDPSALVFDLNTKFVGPIMTDLMHLLVVTSYFAGCLALQNACSRYLLTLGGRGILPRAFCRISPTTNTPSVAGAVNATIVFAALVVFAIVEADPYLQVVPWTNMPTIIAVLALQILTSVAVVRFFRRSRHGEDLWHRLLAPLLAIVVLTGGLAILLAFMSGFTGVAFGWNVVILAPLPVSFIAAFLRAAMVHRRTSVGDTDITVAKKT